MKIELANGLPYHPTMLHPRTGERLRAIAVLNGKPLWPIMGASEDDGKGDEKPDADKKEGGEKGDEAKQEEKAPTGDAARIAQLEEDIAKMRTHLSASDSKKSALERELEALKNKDLPEIERLKKEAKAREDRDATTSKTLRNLAITNAFLTSSQKAKVNWHDVTVSQAAAVTAGGFEVDENGVVTGMDDVVKKLVKEKAFLVDAGKAEKEEEKEDKKNGPSGSSAVGTGGKGKPGKAGELSKEELRRKYAALRQ